MPKNKPNKGLLKRVRITKSGKVKLSRAYGRHRRSHKPGSLLRSYRKPKYASAADGRRVKAMLLMPIQSHEARQSDAQMESGAESSS